LGCLSVYYASRKLFNRRCAILASLISSSAFLYIAINHMLTMDAGLSFFMSLSLLSFMLGLRASSKTTQSLYLWLAYIAAGLAFLCKGLIGIVFPMMIIGLWIVVLNRWYVLKQMRIVSGIILFLLVVLPWLILAQKAVPSFFHEFFIVEEFARYATPIEHRAMPLSSYIAVVLFGFFPWTVWIVQTIRYNLPKWELRHHSPAPVFLLVWAGAITLFFACSHSILIPYLLPIIIPLSILTARYIDSRWDQAFNRSQKISTLVFMLVCMLIGIGLFFVPKFQEMTRIHYSYSLLIVVALFFLISGILSLYFLVKQHFKALIISMAILPWLAMNVVWLAAPYIVNRSILPLAMDLKPLLAKHPNAAVVSFRTYYQDLPYYIQRQVLIVDWQDELLYGLENQADAKNWMINDSQFYQLWQSPQTVYAIMSQNDYQAQRTHYKLFVIDQTKHDVLVSNQVEK
jgi:4-amino-4-deoxy-L-arabinose transferase-like glycosyltransferase